LIDITATNVELLESSLLFKSALSFTRVFAIAAYRIFVFPLKVTCRITGRNGRMFS